MSFPLLFAIRGAGLGLFGLWLLLSIWHQFVLVAALARGRWLKRLSWDVFSLVPYWCFWTGSPRRDCLLLYRDKLIDGRLTAWQNAWEVSPDSWVWIWSPQCRKARVIEKWIDPLRSLAEGKTEAGRLFLSRLYVSVASYTSALQRSQWSEFRQFMIAKVAGFDQEVPAEILFVSPLFRLEDEP